MRPNNTNVNVHGAVITTRAIARVHPVHLMNAVQRLHAAADPQTKLIDLGCETTCKLLPTASTIANYYYYSINSQKLTLILSSHGKLKAESIYSHCSKGAQPVPRALAVVIN